MTQHREFLETHLGSMRGNAIMGIATGRTKTNKLSIEEFQWFKYPEELDQMVEYAEKERTGDRRNVYYSPVIYGDILGNDKRPSRSARNALYSQTIYLDSDLCPPEKFRIPPTTHVQSSAGKGQDYWVLPEPIAAVEASEISRRMAIAHKDDGCDPSSWSANKLLRMPTWNTKDPDNVQAVTWETTGEIWDDTDLLGAYENVEVPKGPAIRGVMTTHQNVPTPEGLPDNIELLALIPETERRLNELIYKVPREGDGGWRSEQRYALLLDLFRFGFNIEQTVSVAWHCPAANKWRTDERGVGGLWGEAVKAQAEVEQERGGGESAAPAIRVERTATAKIKILKPSERSFAEGRETFIEQYGEYAKTRVKKFNGPYHSINAITILATAFSAFAYIPKPGGAMPLNVYSMTLGASSTGKTESSNIMWQFIHALYPHDSPDIGGNHSESALIEMLLDRNGKPSIMWTDEADGLLAVWANGGWATGIQQTVTRVYEGGVPQLGRVGRSELRVHDAKSAMSSHLMGTITGMSRVLNPPMFESGFLARQIFSIGERAILTREDIKVKQVTGNAARSYNAMPKYFSDRFAKIRTKLTAESDQPLGSPGVPVLLTDEAARRFEDAQWDILKQSEKLPGNSEIYATCNNRMFDTIWKVAALLALSEGSAVAGLDHITLALHYAETWYDHLFQVIDSLADSVFSTACDEIEKYIASREGKEAEAAGIYAIRRAEPVRVVDEYIKSLLTQRRISERQPKAGGPRYYKIKE